MKKTEFIKIFDAAMKSCCLYIGVGVQTEGSSRPEIIINPVENFEEKLRYYKAAYDEDMVLASAKGKKDIRIIAVAAGDSFSDIQFLLQENRPDWKRMISETIDRVVNRMLESHPDVETEQRDTWMVILEGYKEQFYKNRYTVNQQKFIVEHIDMWEDMFETCMNGSNEAFKEKFLNLSKELNKHA